MELTSQQEDFLLEQSREKEDKDNMNYELIEERFFD
jgi:hypothetical protein